MASLFDPNPNATRKRRRKLDPNTHHHFKTKWKSDADHRTYSIKLIRVLRNRNAHPVAGGPRVRETADRVLAVAAKGRTRWSRAILTNRLKMNKIKCRKSKKATVTGYCRSKKVGGRRKLPALKRKVRVLSRLVPGCRKLSLPNLLEETTDYIAALEMQVRAMTALAGLFTGTGLLGSSSN